MRDDFPRFAQGGGDVLLVPRHALRVGPGALTHGEIADALADPFAASALRELADTLGYVGSHDDRDALAEFLSARVADESLAVVLLPTPMTGRPILDRALRPAEWSEAVPLSSLQRTPKHTEVEPDIRTGCVRLVGMLFELNKAFLLPRALEGIRLLAHMYQRIPNAEILVVGHTDRTGKAFRNDSLSLERAEAVIAYMTDDVDAWLAFYGAATDESRRWGATEDLAMLSALPRAERPYYSPEHDEHSFEAAVRRFQSAHGLVVDGTAGPQTRRALVEQYMALDGTTLPAGTRALAHGCGEHFPVVPTDDGVEQLENRRVEVFFFGDGIAPRPSAKISKAGASEYPQWNDAVDEERTFTPSLAGRGTVAVVTDYAIGYARHVGLVLELRSVDGAYVRSVEAPTIAEAPNELLEVSFADVPVASFLTLVATSDDGVRDVLFEDVPFAELARQHGDDVEEDPFAVTEPTVPQPWDEE